MSLIVDMVEYLGYELLNDKWMHLAEALYRFATDKNIDVR